MNKTLFALPFAAVALFATSTTVLALEEKPNKANRQNAAHTPAERLKTLTEKLSLTEEQQGKIKAIFEKNMPKLKELRADTALSKEDRRAKLMEIRKAEAQEIRAVLTPEQQGKMKEMRAAGKGRKAAK